MTRVAIIARNLLAEPAGRLELIAFGFTFELDLSDQQALELTLEDVELDLISNLSLWPSFEISGQRR